MTTKKQKTLSLTKSTRLQKTTTKREMKSWTVQSCLKMVLQLTHSFLPYVRLINEGQCVLLKKHMHAYQQVAATSQVIRHNNMTGNTSRTWNDWQIASISSWTERYLQHKVSLPGKQHPGRHSDSELATLQPGDSQEHRQVTLWNSLET